jgi:transcriptional regulator with XRE-family HTH domain
MIAVETTPTPDRGEFAREIERLRKRLGLTRYKAAKRAGLSPSTWGQIENGYFSQGGVRNAPKPKPDTVRRIAGVLGWDLAEAFKVAGIEFTPDDLPPNDDEMPIDDGTFLELLGGMLPMQRKVLYGLMRTMHDPHTDVDKLLAA